MRTIEPLRVAATALVAVEDRDVAEGMPVVVEEEVVVPATRLEARKGRSAAASTVEVVVVVAVVGRVRTTRRAAPTPVTVAVVVVAMAADDRDEADVEAVARGLMASLSAALPLSSLPAMLVRVRLALVRSPSAALFRVPRTPEAADAADALVGAVTPEAGLDGPASVAAASTPYLVDLEATPATPAFSLDCAPVVEVVLRVRSGMRRDACVGRDEVEG